MLTFNIDKDVFERDFQRPELLLVKEGKYWTHRNREESESASVWYDKGIQEQIRTALCKQHPRTSVLSEKSSVRDIVLPHAKNFYVLHVDIKNYYQSINFGHIKKFLTTCTQFDAADMKIIEKFYFYDQGLRKGLYGSSIISEIVGLKIDSLTSRMLYEEADSSVVYSRYYDDLLFSCNSMTTLRRIERKVKDFLASLGFAVNTDKTKLFIVNNAKILGLRIHDGLVTIPKAYKKTLRPKIFISERLWQEGEASGWSNIDIAEKAQKSILVVLGTLLYIIDNNGGDVAKYKRWLEVFRKRQSVIDAILQRFSGNTKVFANDAVPKRPNL